MLLRLQKYFSLGELTQCSETRQEISHMRGGTKLQGRGSPEAGQTFISPEHELYGGDPQPPHPAGTPPRRTIGSGGNGGVLPAWKVIGMLETVSTPRVG